MSPFVAIAAALFIVDIVLLLRLRRVSTTGEGSPAVAAAVEPHHAVVSGLSRLGDEEALHRDLRKLIGRYRRHDDPFCVVLVEVAQATDPGAPLSNELTEHAARVLLETARTEDSVCRLDNHTFVALLTTTDADGAARFADRTRGHLSSSPAQTAAGRIYLIIVTGVVEWQPDFRSVDSALRMAGKQLDLERRGIASQRDWLATQREGVPAGDAGRGGGRWAQH